jgi:hypothetical protein
MMRQLSSPPLSLFLPFFWGRGGDRVTTTENVADGILRQVIVNIGILVGNVLRKRSLALDISVLGYIGILYHKEHPPEVWHIPPGTPCIRNVEKSY